LTTIECHQPVSEAAHLMTAHAYSQLPVTVRGRLAGSVSESHLFAEIVKNPELLKGPVDAIMEPAIPFADISTGVDALAGMLTDQSPAVLVRDFKSDETYIITRWDVIKALS
jgi:predicted transcriptional regulator